MAIDDIDILADWKENRFVVIDDLLLETPVAPAILIILTDTAYWVRHFDELSEWCKDHSCEVSGLSVTLPGPKELTAFNLRWA